MSTLTDHRPINDLPPDLYERPLSFGEAVAKGLRVCVPCRSTRTVADRECYECGLPVHSYGEVS